ncbi:MAG: hypothetical protein CL609_23320, partial [Anaerolineaceae bacterium]|nr:hypothetical protein [Anaerolineaceae bacterium]
MKSLNPKNKLIKQFFYSFFIFSFIFSQPGLIVLAKPEIFHPSEEINNIIDYSLKTFLKTESFIKQTLLVASDEVFVFLPLLLNNYQNVPKDGPDLKITKSDQGATGIPGESLVYEITINNFGPGDASGVVVVETIPENTTFNANQSTNGWSVISGTNQVQYEVGNFAEAESETLHFAVTLNSDIQPTVPSITNTVTISDDESHGLDPNPNNNRAVETTLIEPPTGNIDLNVQLSTVSATTTPGDAVIYSISYANNGTEPASGVVITESLPDQTTFNELLSTSGWSAGSENEILFSVGDLAASENRSVSFAVTVNDPIPAGIVTIENAVTITDDLTHGADLNIFDNSDSVSIPLEAQPDLSLVVQENAANITPGDTLNYSIQGSNLGNQGATGVTINAQLPANTIFNAAGSTTGWLQVGSTSEYQFSLGSLLAETNSNVLFSVMVTDSVPSGVETISGIFTIFDDSSNGVDPDLTNNTVNRSTTLVAAPDLTLTKSADSSLVKPGEVLIYTLAYANQGNQGASGVELIETLPENTSFDPTHSSIGWQQVDSNTQYTFALNTLNSGINNSVTFAVQVTDTPPDGFDTVSNTAEIHDDGNNGTDLNINDNTASLQTTLSLAPDLSISKNGKALIEPGDSIPYTITYANSGYAPATQVVITEALPDNTTINTALSDPTWVQIGSTNQYTYTLSELASGANGEVIFAVDVNDPIPDGTASVINMASISDDGTHGMDPQTENNTGTFTSLFSSGPTEFCGTISENTTWSANQSPYVLTCDVTINAGVTLTIEAGTIIKPNSTSRKLNVNGTLQAVGTERLPITFTSYKDDSVGGDTNGDADVTSPTRGDWSTIYVGDTGQVNMNYVALRYGGYSSSYYANLYLTQNASAIVENSVIAQSSYYGIRVNNTTSGKESHLTVNNSIIENNTQRGVFIYTSNGGTSQVNVTNTLLQGNGNTGFETNNVSGLTLNNNTFTNNEGYAAYLSFSSGSYSSLTSNSGSGNAKNGIALAGSLGQDLSLPYTSNLIYILPNAGLVVNPGVTLTIPSGQIIKADSTNSKLFINGSILSQGSSDSPIYFTSIYDDSIGGDDNSDEAATSPDKGDWAYIQIGDGGSVQLDYTHILFGGSSYSCSYSSGIYTYSEGGSIFIYKNAQITLNHSSVQYSAKRGVLSCSTESSDIASITINNSVLENNTSGIYTHRGSTSGFGTANIVVNSSSISNNSSDGIFNNTAGSLTVSNSNINENGGNGIKTSSNNTLSISASSLIENGDNGIWSINIVQAFLDGNSFINNAGYAAYVDLENGSYSSSSNNIGTGNGKNGIALAGSLGQDLSLPYTSNLIYILPNAGLVVNPGVTLTIP